MIDRNVLLGIAAIVTAGAAPSDPVPAPTLKVGDTWIFDQTIERGAQGYSQQRLALAIQRIDAVTMLVGIKRDGAPSAYEDHVLGADWSIRRILNGQEATTARPFTFPMRLGQTWTVDYTDPTPRGPQTSVHVHRTYKVADWEDVTVPAGTFHAIRVEASGVDQAVVNQPGVVVGSAVGSPNGGATVTRSQPGGMRVVAQRHHADLYYVPATKYYVKSVEEHYNADEVLVSRETRTLISFRPAA